MTWGVRRLSKVASSLGRTASDVSSTAHTSSFTSFERMQPPSRPNMLLMAMTLTVMALIPGSLAVPARERPLKPCPDGFQAVVVDGKQDCVCADYHVYWPHTGLCYPEFTRGPCGRGQQLAANDTGHAECRCPGFWARYKDGACYQEYTQGPCQVGELFMGRTAGGEGFCSCSPEMVMHYFRTDGRCYPLYEQGPCPKGHLLKFDYRTLEPVCECRDGFMLEDDGVCYELNTAGLCDQTKCLDGGINCYVRNLDTLKTECTCLPGNVTTADGHCFQPYSRGPCPLGNWLVFSEPGVAVCERKTQCARFDNWFFWTPDQRCYRQYSRGPCPEGQLFYLDLNTGVSGCHCRRDWTPYYWAEDGQCYEQHSVGPCPAGMYFSFNQTSGQTECNCFTSHVLHEESQTCYERLTRGPCPEGQLVTEDPATGRMTCDCHAGMSTHYWSRDASCYQHFLQGPCASGQTFRLDPVAGTPACITWG
ncbi:uncharacterized protein LOC134768282 isoform X1 [Penaeus indicus]|uniref:uncharacterized protein LOC134768282 isoform X1 n=2 Tax=Penaeus indicus TaxID=29960 RepID=UPI00300CE4CC